MSGIDRRLHRHFAKVRVTPDIRTLMALIATQQQSVRDAFMEFVNDVKSPAVIARVQKMIQDGDVEGALNLADSYVIRFANSLSGVFTAAGIAAAKELEKKLAGAKLAISFDPTHGRAAALMRANQLGLVKDFTEAQRSVTRSALTDALAAGQGPRAAARVFSDTIGLTDTQYAAVNTYRDLLLANSSDALDRVLRDRRSDGAVNDALQSGDPLSSDQVDRMVGAYEGNMIDLRAETIARTETHRILNQARQEALQQSLDQAGIDAGNVTRTWVATDDDRTRDTHAEMDGQQVGMDEPFESPSGEQLMYPGDPDASPEETINCRCVVTVSIDSST